MRQFLKKIIPNAVVQKIRNYIYFTGYGVFRPRVFCVIRDGKRLFLSNMIDITHWSKLDIGDNVFIWHFTILDTFNGIKIGNDCQIGTRVGIFTHSSHNSIRIYNSKYHDVHFDSHHGRKRGSVEIGDCTFVGANSIIMPGTKIGRGCIVGAFSYVTGEFDDFAIIAGNPAKKIGDVRPNDLKLLRKNPELIENYLKAFHSGTLEELMGQYYR